MVKPSVAVVSVADDLPLGLKLLAAGTSASFADFCTFPLDTAKVRLQIQGEAKTLTAMGNAEVMAAAAQNQYRGVVGTIMTIARNEGPLSLFNGLSAGLQRQMCFASVRLGMYDTVRDFYTELFYGKTTDVGLNIPLRILAGGTTGCMAVVIAQPTDVVKVRFQAQLRGAGELRYSSTMQAYRTIAVQEGARGLWKGAFANCGRNAIVNISEIVCYDIIKESILKSGFMGDTVPCHFVSAVAAGFCTTFFASPVDVVKTRFMNSKPGTYKSALNCAVKMFAQEGFSAFYKGFMPSFARLVSWNIVMWLTYEQVKKFMAEKRKAYYSLT
uniref:Mitochondrial uncoupling protein 2 n=1 Tax=Homalodisca liturata TaxID=320908 RepID=A0A1B6JK02_9HEMI